MPDPKDKKHFEIEVDRHDATKEEGRDFQERLEDTLIEADEALAEDFADRDKESPKIAPQVPSITTDMPPSEEDQKE